MLKKLPIAILLIYCLVACTPASFSALQRNEHCAFGEKLGLPVYEWKDDLVPTKALVVALHGLTFYGYAFDDTASHLASQGYPVYALDLRGFGRWRAESNKYPSDGKIHYSQVLEDAQRLIDCLHRENPEQKIFCLGESLGANLALFLAAGEPQALSGAILAGLCVKQTFYPQPRWVEDFWRSLLFPNRPFNLAPYSKRFLASDSTVVQTYLNDPQIFRQLTCVDLIKAIVTYRRAVKQIHQIPPSVQILILAGGKDQSFKSNVLPGFVKRLGRERTTLKILPDKGHLILELQPLDPEIATIMDDWLNEQTSQRKYAHVNDLTDGRNLPPSSTAVTSSSL